MHLLSVYGSTQMTRYQYCFPRSIVPDYQCERRSELDCFTGTMIKGAHSVQVTLSETILSEVNIGELYPVIASLSMRAASVSDILYNQVCLANSHLQSSVRNH